MIHEFARLQVIKGQERAFEQAFAEAKQIISAMPGFLGLNLYRHHDGNSPYLLHVRWSDIEAHRSGFRLSEGYQKWRKLLHRFYDPFPTVEYFETVCRQPADQP